MWHIALWREIQVSISNKKEACNKKIILKLEKNVEFFKYMNAV